MFREGFLAEVCCGPRASKRSGLSRANAGFVLVLELGYCVGLYGCEFWVRDRKPQALNVWVLQEVATRFVVSGVGS